VRHVIVDGYNVLHAYPAYERLLERDVDAARVRLVEDVATWAAGESRAVVVFDGAGNPGSDGRPHHVAHVAVIFSAAGTDADTVIETLAHRYRAEGLPVLVATSDQETQNAVMGSGAVRISSAEFARELADARREAGTHGQAGSARGRLEERIDPLVREVMWRWARGR
jgi:predicted RNA-binding protein with PIN domain